MTAKRSVRSAQRVVASDAAAPVPLPRDFYDRPADVVARQLLGKQLIGDELPEPLRGRIVEVEAYLPVGDPACHAARGRNRKNASMFGPPGIAYVYAIHARWCFNVVTEPEDVPSAVLVRAVRPLAGLARMQERRGVEREFDYARGPARLCQAFDIDRRLDGCDLTLGQRLWIADDPEFDAPTADIGVSPRIGVTSAKDLPLRFFLRDADYVSGPKKVVRRGEERVESGPSRAVVGWVNRVPSSGRRRGESGEETESSRGD